MPIAIDASSPALTSGTGSTRTTAAFSPPARSLLVACIAFEAVGMPEATLTVSNTGTSLTWTARVRRDSRESGANSGIAALYTATNANAQSGITVTAVSGRSSDAGGLKVLVVTGADLTSPVGATGEGSTSEVQFTDPAYTSTKDGSRCVAMGSDFAANGTPTSTDVGFGFLVASRLDGLALHKASNTVNAGTSVSVNFNNNSGSHGLWNWVAAEVLPEPEVHRQRAFAPVAAVRRAATY